jgi:hypothetical protein
VPERGCEGAGQKRGAGRRPVAFDCARAWAQRGKRGRGVWGEDATRRGNGRGAWPRPMGGAPTMSQPTATQPQRARATHSVSSRSGKRRIADAWDLAGSGRGWRGVRVGRPGKVEVGQAGMDSDDCELFKWISNEFDLTKRWTYLDPKFLNKIWLERA